MDEMNYVYLMSEQAAALLKEIQSGVAGIWAPGAHIVIPLESLIMIRDGMIVIPLKFAPSNILVMPDGEPDAGPEAN